jgi:hypothetical protein
MVLYTITPQSGIDHDFVSVVKKAAEQVLICMKPVERVLTSRSEQPNKRQSADRFI